MSAKSMLMIVPKRYKLIFYSDYWRLTVQPVEYLPRFSLMYIKLKKTY